MFVVDRSAGPMMPNYYNVGMYYYGHWQPMYYVGHSVNQMSSMTPSPHHHVSLHDFFAEHLWWTDVSYFNQQLCR